MVAAPKQVSIGGLGTETDESDDIEAARVWRAQLWSALRMFVETYVDSSGLKKYDGCAHRLNKIWEDEGRPVTAGALRNALAPTADAANRNNFRLEWAYWFASQDQDVARLLGMHVKPEKTAEQLLNDQETAMREVLTHKQVEQIKRRSRIL